jgi:hypothetical protein
MRLRRLLPMEAPGIQFRFVSVNRAQPAMPVPVHRQALLLFPALEGAHIPFEISGDFLPGIQEAALGGIRGQGLRNRRSLTHSTSTNSLAQEVASFYALCPATFNFSSKQIKRQSATFSVNPVLSLLGACHE